MLIPRRLFAELKKKNLNYYPEYDLRERQQNELGFVAEKNKNLLLSQREMSE